MKTTIISIAALIVGVAIGFSLEKERPTTCENHEKVMWYYERYYNASEALLDSICNDWESFMDVTMEADVYYEYEVAKEDLQVSLEEDL